MSAVPEPFLVSLSVVSTAHPALMAEGTRFLDAVRTAQPYQLAVSPTPGLHQQVCRTRSLVGRRRAFGLGTDGG